MIVHSVLADDLHVHVLQHNAVESHGELLLGEVGLGEHRDLQDGFLLPDWSSTHGRCRAEADTVRIFRFKIIHLWLAICNHKFNLLFILLYKLR